MSQIRANKVQVPTNSDAYNLTGDLATMADTSNTIVKVASQSERDALVKANGLVVARQDLGGGVIEACDGTSWWKVGGMQHAEFTGSTTLPAANTNWGPGPLTIDSANSVNSSFVTSPSNDALALPAGLFYVSARMIMSVSAAGAQNFVAINDSTQTTTYYSHDLSAGESGTFNCMGFIYLPSAATLKIRLYTGATGGTVASRIRVTRLA